MKVGAVAAGCCILAFSFSRAVGADVPVDRSAYIERDGFHLSQRDHELELSWRGDGGLTPSLVLSLEPGRPLVSTMRLVASSAGVLPLVENVDPVVRLTEGSRRAPKDRPPEMSVFNTFFDTPANRPTIESVSRFDYKSVRVSTAGKSVFVTIGELKVGSFTGAWVFSVRAGSPLVKLEAVVSTHEPDRAVMPALGLVGSKSGWDRYTWMDTEGAVQSASATAAASENILAVRHRTLVASRAGLNSIAIFPPPHQYLFPRDRTDNPRLIWFGAKYKGSDWPAGIGIGQDLTGGGAYVPWFNAPPGSRQRFAMFVLLAGGEPKAALKRVLAYTHEDKFKPFPGRKTFASHWHMAITMADLDRAKGKAIDKSSLDFINMFHDMGVNLVHLGEFHGDGHQKDPGPLRLPELEAEFALCKRISNDKTLFMPGEEVDEFLGLPAPGRQSGHWMILFPKPVLWTMRRGRGQELVEMSSRGEPIYHIGNRDDMIRLIEREHALVWSSHPRIKASSWTPDVFFNEGFFKAPYWLGGAWKAMPADLSEPRLGSRVLNLLDDMQNRGEAKYAPGEADVFKIDHTHELYGHMNVNYLKLDRTPDFARGWGEVLDALRAGEFFVTTGEVLIPSCSIAGAESGTVKLAQADRRRVPVKIAAEWTFPPAFLEVVSGDGHATDRKRLDLADLPELSSREFAFEVDLTGKTWARVELWDIATNGAFTQPIRIVEP